MILSRNMSRFLLAVIVAGIALRIGNAFHDPSLWMDEVFSAKMAESPLSDLLLAVPRFDTHPPLYYLQLHFWALPGSGDLWLILNSVLLDSLVVLSLLRVVGAFYGRPAGLVSAAIYAVLPLSVFFAENVRMYALLFLLSVWLWFLLEHRCRDGVSSGKSRIVALLLGLAVTMTHGLGFFVAFFLYAQALVRIWSQRRGEGARPAAVLVLDYVPVALFALYSIGIGSFRRTEGLDILDLESIGVHLAISLAGMGAPIPAATGYLAFAAFVVPPLFDARARGVSLGMVVLPWAALLLLSLSIKTVFMYRTLGLFLPFQAIAMGVFLSNLWTGQKGGRLALPAAIVVLASFALNSSIQFEKANYRDIAAIWDREAEADAVLVVDGVINLWGVSRYLSGTPDYSALDVQPPVRDGMLRLKERLAGGPLDRAGFFGRTDHLEIGDRQIWPWPNVDALKSVGAYWLLDPPDGTCLRDSDQQLQQFTSSGKVLIQCR